MDTPFKMEEIRALMIQYLENHNNQRIVSAFLDVVSHYKFLECLTENVMALMAQTRFHIIGHIKDILQMDTNFVDERGSGQADYIW